MISGCKELSNGMWHESKSYLHQKILTADKFPGTYLKVKSYLHQKILTADKFLGTYLIGNISIIINATAVIKYFFQSTLKEEVIDICC